MKNNPTSGEITLRKKILFSLTALMCLTIFLIITSEIILRLKGFRPWQPVGLSFNVEPAGKLYRKDPTLGYTNIPGRFTITLADGYSFTATNLSNGLRITHPLITYGTVRPKDEIWIFGCSFTYGWGLNDPETFPWLLQERFSNYEVVNFGVDGYNTVQSLLQFREALASGRVPKAVLLCFASWHDERNIFSRNWQKAIISLRNFGQLFYPYARFDEYGKLHYYWGEVNFFPFPFMKYSSLMNFVEENFDKLEDRYYKISEVTKALLLEFANTGKKAHIPVVIAGITHSPGTRKMLAFERENGVKAVDISVDLNIRENTNYPHDGHPGRLADRKYADALETFLREKILQ
jgi:hypothetical protein